MGAFSTGLMLMGIALIYGAKASFSLDIIGAGNADKSSPLFSAGLLLLMFSMAFKVSAAPFHFWTPDVYDGAPGVFTSFMATISKGSRIYCIYQVVQRRVCRGAWSMAGDRFYYYSSYFIYRKYYCGISAECKRMLAYSSIAQAGFMLFAIVALNSNGNGRINILYRRLLLRNDWGFRGIDPYEGLYF